MSSTMTISPYGECRLWPFPPNWRQSWTMNFEHLTEVLNASRVGREQRRSYRQTPRKIAEFSVTTTAESFRLMQALLASNQAAPFVVPEINRKLIVTAGLAGDGVDDTITVDGALPWWAVADAPVVIAVGRNYYLRVIESVAGSDITFTTAETDVIPAGAKVHPGLISYLAEVMAPQHQTNHTAVVSVRAAVLPASEPARSPAAAAVTFNNREVFLRRFNWAQLPRNEFAWPAEDVDFSVGTIRRFLPIDFSSRTIQASFVSESNAQAVDLEDFYLRMRGQADEFYVPTWENNLPPKTALTSGGSQLRTAGTTVYDAYFGSTVYKAIAVVLKNGTIYYRLVSTMTTNAGDTLVTLVGTWPATIQPSEILMVSWLPACRLAGDNLVVEWLTDNVAKCQLAFRTLEDLAMGPGDLP